MRTSPDVWKTLATELGLAGLLVPESLGGAGVGTREAAVVMEEIGRAIAPVPFLSSAVLATVALLKAGETQTLPSLADGSATGALAIPLSTPPGASHRNCASWRFGPDRTGHQCRRR